MTFNDYINGRRKELHMTVEELSERSGLPKGTVSKITAGINGNPKLTTIEAICRALGCSIDEAAGLTAARVPVFTRSEGEHLRKYRALDGHGRELLDTVLEMEYQRCVSVKTQGRVLRVPYYLIPVSAGLGNPLDEAPAEEVEIADTAEHRRGDFVVKVSGDSMMPLYCDGDRVLVQRQPSVERGEIGIFVLNGESYIKKLGEGKLISLNPHYPPKPYGGADYIICCGKVIGKVN